MCFNLNDGLTGLCWDGSWIPWRVLYKNPSKSLNESAPLYCSPAKKCLLNLFWLKQYKIVSPWLARLFIVPLNLSASCFTITASFAFGARIWSRFNSRSSWIKCFSSIFYQGFKNEATWKIRRSIWYFRTCTGAPSVTVWKRANVGFMISEFPVFFCSTCIVFFWRLIPIRLGFVSLPVLHNVGGRSGDVKGPGNATVLVKKGPNMIVTWSGGVPWSLRDWPLGCWSSWTVLKVVIDLRKHYFPFSWIPKMITLCAAK